VRGCGFTYELLSITPVVLPQGYLVVASPLMGELAILQRGRESSKKAILLFANDSQLVKTNLKKGA